MISANMFNIQTKTLELPGNVLSNTINFRVFESAFIRAGRIAAAYLNIDAQVIWFKAPNLVLGKGIFTAHLIVFDNFNCDCKNLTFNASQVEYRNMTQEQIYAVSNRVFDITNISRLP